MNEVKEKSQIDIGTIEESEIVIDKYKESTNKINSLKRKRASMDIKNENLALNVPILIQRDRNMRNKSVIRASSANSQEKSKKITIPGDKETSRNVKAILEKEKKAIIDNSINIFAVTNIHSKKRVDQSKKNSNSVSCVTNVEQFDIKSKSSRPTTAQYYKKREATEQQQILEDIMEKIHVKVDRPLIKLNTLDNSDLTSSTEKNKKRPNKNST